MSTPHSLRNPLLPWYTTDSALTGRVSTHLIGFGSGEMNLSENELSLIILTLSFLFAMSSRVIHINILEQVDKMVAERGQAAFFLSLYLMVLVFVNMRVSLSTHTTM